MWCLKSSEYGLRAVVFIAIKSSEGLTMNVKEISAEIESPEAFTAKILKRLATKKIVDSIQGAKGGYYMKSEVIKLTTLYEVITAIEGDDEFKKCFLGLKDCGDEKPCPVHHKFKPIKADLIDSLKSTTIYELSQNMKLGNYFLNNN